MNLSSEALRLVTINATNSYIARITKKLLIIRRNFNSVLHIEVFCYLPDYVNASVRTLTNFSTIG